MKLIQFLPCILLALPVAAESNTGHILGPVLGFVKKAEAVAPILGIPGSAYLGSLIDMGGLQILGVSSERSYALVLTPDRTGLRLYPLRPAGAAEPRVIADLESAVDVVAISPSGTAAALVRGREGLIDVITGLPDQPLLKTLAAPSVTTMIAVADDGQAIAAAEPSVISIITASGKQQIAAAQSIRDLRFRPRSHDLIYADAASAQIVLWQNSARVIAGPADGLSEPARAVFSRDGRFVFISAHGTKDLLIASASGTPSRHVPLPCEPSDLEPLSDSALRFTCESDRSIYLLHVSSAGVRLLFVPSSVE
jgi:hypothetical protein